ncbi:MAG: cation-translocating P-type ATPase [Candidatus Micrarchaeia archaeon]
MQKNECSGACTCGSGGEPEEKGPLWKQKTVAVLAFSLVVLAMGLYFEFFLGEELLGHVLYLAVVISSGKDILARAWTSLLGKRLDMNVLIAVSAAGAFLSGHAEEGASVIFLFAIAEFLEEYAEERSRDSIAKLLSLAPDTARVRKGGQETEVDVRRLAVGDVVIVKHGDKVPVDGKVVRGASHVNEAPITGESTPQVKRVGDSVYAGTINGDGYLEVRVAKASGQTIISKIAKFVEDARKQKSKTERFVDKFASYYTPLVIIASVAVAVVPTLVFGQPFGDWFYRALVLLVAACPCALAISTPVSLVSSLTSAARNGLLVKGGDYLEEASRARAVVFDKTGTLTKGVFEVDDVVPVNGFGRNELLEIAASLESSSSHPIAAAILRKAPKKLRPVSGFASVTGKGVRGTINGTEYSIGNLKLPVQISASSKDVFVRLEREGKTVVAVSKGRSVIGMISISDRIRPEARRVVSELVGLGITPIMLTGDNEETAKAVSKKTGIAIFRSGMLPQDKLAEVNRLKREYGKVIFVGDGINDTPALAAANVGMAMGAIGSDVAIETADIAIMNDDLNRIPFLIRQSRKTMVVVKENVGVSILVKGSVGVMAVLGMTSLWVAVAVGDMGLSLLVILNALRLGLTKQMLPF